MNYCWQATKSIMYKYKKIQKKYKNVKKNKKMIVAVFRSCFFSGSCFASVEWRWYMLNGLFLDVLNVTTFCRVCFITENAQHKKNCHWHCFTLSEVHCVDSFALPLLLAEG